MVIRNMNSDQRIKIFIIDWWFLEEYPTLPNRRLLQIWENNRLCKIYRATNFVISFK